MKKKCLLIAAFCLLLSGCGADPTNNSASLRRTADANPMATLIIIAPTPQNPNVTPIPFNLLEKLQTQGLTVSPNGLDTTFAPVTQVSGNILMVNQERVTYYEFPDSASAQAIIISGDGTTFKNSKGATVNGSPVKVGPHVYRKDNVIVSYVGEDKTILNALIAVMGNQIAGT